VAAPTKKELAWPVFDYIVRAAAAVNPGDSPWVDGKYQPDYETLSRLLGVPLNLNADTTSGVPALALDVWVAYELRRAGFDEDGVWPRPLHPRIMPGPISALRAGWGKKDIAALSTRLDRRTPLKGVVATSANILGKNYLKQVDVVMSAWDTGPEILISTKRMDSSFGKNAANRVEESYGDAKNLRSRHPLAALGFVYALRSTILQEEPDKADWLIDLLQKLGREDDAYDAVTLLMIEYEGSAPPDSDGGHADEDALAAAGVTPAEDDYAGDAEDLEPEEPLPFDEEEHIAAVLANLPLVIIRLDEVPAALDASTFFEEVVKHVLGTTPITMHVAARVRAGWPTARAKERKPRKPRVTANLTEQ
jgi:hypothetical protein